MSLVLSNQHVLSACDNKLGPTFLHAVAADIGNEMSLVLSNQHVLSACDNKLGPTFNMY